MRVCAGAGGSPKEGVWGNRWFPRVYICVNYGAVQRDALECVRWCSGKECKRAEHLSKVRFREGDGFEPRSVQKKSPVAQRKRAVKRRHSNQSTVQVRQRDGYRLMSRRTPDRNWSGENFNSSALQKPSGNLGFPGNLALTLTALAHRKSARLITVR